MAQKKRTERSRSFVKVIVKVTEISHCMSLLVLNNYKRFDVDGMDSFEIWKNNHCSGKREE